MDRRFRCAQTPLPRPAVYISSRTAAGMWREIPGKSGNSLASGPLLPDTQNLPPQKASRAPNSNVHQGHQEPHPPPITEADVAVGEKHRARRSAVVSEAGGEVGQAGEGVNDEPRRGS